MSEPKSRRSIWAALREWKKPGGSQTSQKPERAVQDAHSITNIEQRESFGDRASCGSVRGSLQLQHAEVSHNISELRVDRFGKAPRDDGPAALEDRNQPDEAEIQTAKAESGIQKLVRQLEEATRLDASKRGGPVGSNTPGTSTHATRGLLDASVQKAGITTSLRRPQSEPVEHDAAAVGALRSETTRLSAEVATLQKTLRALCSAGDLGMTPRAILAMKLVASFSPGSPTAGSFAGAALDKPLSGAELQRFLEHLESAWDPKLCQEISIKHCQLCEAPMFLPRNDESAAHCTFKDCYIGPGKLVCCSTRVCAQCEYASFDEQLNNGWWQDPETTPLFKCPVKGCTAPPVLDDDANAATAVQLFDGSNFDSKMQMYPSVYSPTPSVALLTRCRYKRVKAVRSALLSLEPRPSQTARELARNIHDTLVAQKKMRSIARPNFQDSGSDGAVDGAPLEPGAIQLFRVDSVDGPLDVPFLMASFIKSSVSRECEICCETISEIDIGSTQEWTMACRDIEGEWMWKVLRFPSKLELACSHPVNFCRDCLAKHLKTTLDVLGRNRCDELSCPDEGCDRKLTDDEIRLYADAETWES